MLESKPDPVSDQNKTGTSVYCKQQTIYFSEQTICILFISWILVISYAQNINL